MWPFTSDKEKKNDHLVEVYRRHFCVWPHREESLQVFLTELNWFNPTIKFTAKWSRESITFLDMKVIRDGNRLVADLYTKLGSRPLYQSNGHPSVHSPMKLSSFPLQIQHFLQPSTSDAKNLFKIHRIEATCGGTQGKFDPEGPRWGKRNTGNWEGH